MNRSLLLVACLTLAGPLPAAAMAAAPAADPLVVATSAGLVRGTDGPGVREFKGIPYAEAPTGARRWSLPVPKRPWHGVRAAAAYGAACPQVARYGLTEPSDVEDCLYLNVTAPRDAAADGRLRPVIVWIHGGAFVGGSGTLYPLDYLARRGDVVVVSMNYRLGALGFMAHPAFAHAQAGGYALEDQRAALRWVQRNVAAFGGDPHNVTLAGESAGAASVCMHLYAPAAATGLFHKAIVQSAGCTVQLRTVEQSFEIGLKIAARVGCAAPQRARACLRRVPVRDLLEAGTAIASTTPLAFAPSVGSATLPEQGATALSSGRFVRVPILNGGNRDEMRLYVGYDVAAGARITAENYLERLAALYGSAAPEVAALYPPGEYSSAAAALGTVMSDYMPGGALSACLFLDTAARASRYVPVYEYEFADRAAPPVMPDPGFELGAVHSAELPYFFPRFSNTHVLDGPPLAPPSQRLAEQMVAYWSAFAHDGAPAAAGLPEWPRYRSATTVLRLLPEAIATFDAAAAHHCAFWRERYPAAFAP